MPIHGTGIESAYDVADRNDAEQSPLLKDGDASDRVVLHKKLHLAQLRSRGGGHYVARHGILHLDAVQQFKNDAWARIGAYGNGCHYFSLCTAFEKRGS